MKAIFSRQVTVFMLPLLLLVAGALLLTGCESDPVAPHEDAPALTQDDVAYQAGYLGMMFTEVGVQIVDFSQPGLANKNVYTYTFPVGAVTGEVTLDYRLGGADGTPATYSAGDYARLYTMPDAPVVLTLGLGGTASFTFDISGAINQATNTATIAAGSFGTLTSGAYSADFTLEDVVVVSGDDYPSGGSITFTSGTYEMELAYDGDSTGTLSVGGVATWTVDLDDGTLTEI